MVLFLALLCIGGAAYALSEAATYPARVKARSVKRAAEYGRIRIPRSEQELVQFRQRVLSPLAGKLAAIPLKLSPKTNVEAIGEIFNLFNAINPANIESTISSVNQTVRLVGGAANPTYMQPTRFAGDFQQPEQRVGQIGFRFTF